MQVAESVTGPTRGLISIGHYLQLEATERPTTLRCAGTDADGRPCAGRAFAKALDSTAKSPHFAAIDHNTGCDEARSRPPTTKPALDSRPRRPERAVAVVTLTANRPPQHAFTHPVPPTGATGVRTRGEVPWPDQRTRHSLLHDALRVLLGRGYRPGELISWRRSDPMPAELFFIHLDAVNGLDDRSRGYWGQIEQAIRFGPTGAVHLQPRHGPRVVLPRAMATHLGLTDSAILATLPGQCILAIGTVRKSRTGHLYVLVNDRSAFASCPPNRSTHRVAPDRIDSEAITQPVRRR